jgi:hypothetical protein
VRIELESRLPIISSRLGTLIIDGYSQPGARPNTLAVGSNAIPGVEVRGNGWSAREAAFRIYSPRNVIEGIAITNVWRGIMVDGVDARGNQILGGLIGFSGTGGNSPTGQHAIVLNVGAHDNIVGTPDLADRNIIGNFQVGIDAYGPGTGGNVITSNVLCIGPSGATALCATGIDHDFGPKNVVIGGDGPNERNISGPTLLQGIEYSHGWDPALTALTDGSLTYRISGNVATGNWVGFPLSGRHDPTYQSAQNLQGADNGQGINCYASRISPRRSPPAWWPARPPGSATAWRSRGARFASASGAPGPASRARGSPA